MTLKEMKHNIMENSLILEEAVRSVKDLEGFACQIGIGRGNDSLRILGELPKDKLLILVDPYGEHEYRTIEDGLPTDKTADGVKTAYSTLASLYRQVLSGNWPYFLYYPMEDIEFYEHFQTGIFFYNNGEKSRLNEYCFVHFNAHKNVLNLLEGIRFFNERMVVGGKWYFEDTDQFNESQHQILDELMDETSMVECDRYEDIIIFEKEEPPSEEEDNDDAE